MRKRMIVGFVSLGLLAGLAGVPGLAQEKMADDKSGKMGGDNMAGDKMSKKKSKKHKKDKMDKMDKMDKKGDGKM